MSQNNTFSSKPSSFLRELTEHEKLILKTIIEKAPSPEEKLLNSFERKRLINSISSAKVVGKCDCGSCCSIELNKNMNPTKRYTLEASTSESMIILFIDDNELSYLELAPFDHNKTFTAFPPIEDLEF